MKLKPSNLLGEGFDESDSDDEFGSDETSRAPNLSTAKPPFKPPKPPKLSPKPAAKSPLKPAAKPPLKPAAKPKPNTISKPPPKRKPKQAKASGPQRSDLGRQTHAQTQAYKPPKPPTISDLAFDTLKTALRFADAADAAIRSRPVGKDQIWDVEPEPIIEATLAGFKTAKRREEDAEFASEGIDGLSDESLFELAPYTDEFGLNDFDGYLRFIPRLVNVVTLAETRPVSGSKTTFPLDLNAIAAKCSSSFFSPRKFSACQLAFAFPRSRILIFHTGRLVGTGAGGAAAARTSILKTLIQLRDEADIHLELVDFVIINQVGAVDLRASLSCDAFASAHTSTAHYDRSSFVGLAWRASGETVRTVDCEPNKHESRFDAF
jgi:TATA-box binding protein (TBP) (component of TFIID and TFIIIB)